jgi:hypothetical protein
LGEDRTKSGSRTDEIGLGRRGLDRMLLSCAISAIRALIERAKGVLMR